jgi:hypothetical protein
VPLAEKELIMGVFKAPKAPDPYATAAAQGAMNKETAIAQQQLNMVDQYGPDGSSTIYQQTGEKTPEGINRFKVTQSLNPTQLAALIAQQDADLKTNNLANNQLDQLQTHLSNPFNLDETDIQARTAAMINPRIQAQIDRNRKAKQEELVNRGVREGSQAYADSMRMIGEQENDAMTQANLASRSQVINEKQLAYDKPINTVAALLGTGQITPQQLVQTPQASIASPDLMGQINANYKARAGQQQAMMGGIFGLGSALVGAGGNLMKSDRRVKTDIQKIGALANGLPLYLFRYKSGGPIIMGVMAQDVEKVMPEAVIEIDGVKHVNYEMAVR